MLRQVFPFGGEGVAPVPRSSDWCRCQPLDITFGSFGRHMKVAW